MDPLTFLASLVLSLAWPATVAVIAWWFRDHIKPRLDRLPKRLKLGPVDVEWYESTMAPVIWAAMKTPTRETGTWRPTR